MKHKFKSGSGVSLIIMLTIMLVIIVGIVIFNIIFQSEQTWKDIGVDLMTALLSSLTVGLIIGTFTKIISDNILNVKKNDLQLRRFGIHKIGGGKSSKKDIISLFGNPCRNIYPNQVKLLFITGNGFVKTFKEEIKNYVSQNNVSLKILVVSCDNENEEYLKRMEVLCPQTNSYRNQILEELIPLLKEIIIESNCKKDAIQLRFYKDEYRYNFRIAKYDDGENIRTETWWNIQPFNRDAVDLSIMLHGESNIGEDTGDNVVGLLDQGFDFLWQKYKHTQHNFYN